MKGFWHDSQAYLRRLRRQVVLLVRRLRGTRRGDVHRVQRSLRGARTDAVVRIRPYGTQAPIALPASDAVRVQGALASIYRYALPDDMLNLLLQELRGVVWEALTNADIPAATRRRLLLYSSNCVTILEVIEDEYPNPESTIH
jgi:hypothetical protein